MAVKSDESCVAISSYVSHSVVLYALPTMERLLSIVERDRTELGCPQCVCFTVDDTLLVADATERRIQDFSLAGI